MKIIKLKAENIKKLIAIEIAPQGNVVKITGKNGAGKTSVLDAIFWALGGLENIQAQPIRKGEKRAEITLTLDDLIVRRTFTEGGASALYVENKEGLRFKSPQTMLDGLLGRLAFDPLEFMRMKPAAQFLTLRQLTGVDLSKLDAERVRLFDERTSINREVKSLESRVAAIEAPVDAPDSEVNPQTLIEKINGALVLKQTFVSYGEKLSAYDAHIKTSEDEIKELNDRIGELQARVKFKEGIIAGSRQMIQEAQTRMSSIIVPDIEALRKELDKLDVDNKAARAKAEKKDLRAALERKEKEADALTTGIASIDEDKQELVATAKFPLDGLGFGDGIVVYNGLPLDQASSAEQLRVSLSMAMALNPKLRVIRVSDGSLLDTDSMAIVEELARDRDYQVWMEVVDESGKVGVVIEDGRVAAVNQ